MEDRDMVRNRSAWGRGRARQRLKMEAQSWLSQQRRDVEQAYDKMGGDEDNWIQTLIRHPRWAGVENGWTQTFMRGPRQKEETSCSCGLEGLLEVFTVVKKIENTMQRFIGSSFRVPSRTLATKRCGLNEIRQSGAHTPNFSVTDCTRR